jgi:hypothetical protein
MKNFLLLCILLIPMRMVSQQYPPYIFLDGAGDPYPSGSGPAIHTNPPYASCYTNATGQVLPCDFSGGGGGGTVSPGTAGQMVYYPTTGSTVGGTPGGTTNGTHFAFGSGSVVDSAPTVFADGVPLSPNVVQTVSETSTDPNLENGLYLGLTLNPSDAVSNSAYALWINANADSGNWNNSTGIRGIAGTVNYIGTGTGANAMQQLGPAIESAVVDSSSGEIQNAYGGQAGIFGIGTGEIDYAEAGRSVNTNLAGIIDSSVEHVFLFQSANGVTDSNVNAQILSPNLSGGATLTANTGLEIDEQCGLGIGTCFELNSEGTGLNYFGGKVQTATTFQEPLTTPASSSAACTAGQFTDDTNYHYVCTATNTWKRVALTTF